MAIWMVQTRSARVRSRDVVSEHATYEDAEAARVARERELDDGEQLEVRVIRRA